MRPWSITSFGGCSPLGRDTAEALRALFAGVTGLAAGRPFPERNPVPFVTPHGRTELGTPDPFELEEVPRGFVTRQDVLAMQGLLTVRDDARAAVLRFGAERVAVIVGTSTGGVEASERALCTLRRTGSLPAAFSYHEHHALGAAVGRIAEEVGAHGPVYAVSTACSSSAKALASAARLLEADLADAVLVGGVDSLCLLTLLGFHGLGVVDADRSKPFSRERRGMNVAEGAAYLLLERERPSSLYLLGAGESNDAHHMAHPHPEGRGALAAMRAALADAGIEPADIDYVNAHGTGTLANDEVEAAVLSQLFGSRPLVSSTKGLTGHLLGASGAMEAMFCVAAIQQGRVPGNGSLAGMPSLSIPERSVSRPVARALSNSFAFGGSNASLVFGSREAALRSGAASNRSLPEGACLAALRLSVPGNEVAAGTLLSMRTLGRSSPLTRTFAGLLSQLADRGADVARLPLVFASAFGEMQTTMELLDLALERGESSPLRFQLSVHNAAQGLLSIATGHRGFATSLSAGKESLAMALVEAFALLAGGHDEVLVLVAEEPSQARLSSMSHAGMGLGLWLRRGLEPSLPRLGVPRRGVCDPAGPPAAVSAELHENPIADALRLVRAHEAGVRACVPLGADRSAAETGWALDYHPPLVP